MDPVFRTTQRAAILLAERTWQAGQSVEAALTAAGYARHVVQGITNYYRGYASSGVAEDTTQPDSQTEMAPRTKRARIGAKTKVAPTVKKYVKKCMDRLVDDKYHSVGVGINNMSTTGSVFADSLLITQGITDATRIGNNIRIKSVKVIGNVSSDTVDTGRIIIAWDKQANGAAPAVTDLLTTAHPLSHYNVDYVVGAGGSRFNILSDRRIAINPEITAAPHTRTYTFNWKGDKVVHYDGTAGAITDLVSNNLIFCYLSTSGSVDFAANMRVKYTDA